jgi:hypothetical protein
MIAITHHLFIPHDMGVSMNGDPQNGFFIMGIPTKMDDN